MRYIIFLSCAVFLSGCSIAYEEARENTSVFARRFISLRDVRNGMSRQEVSELLGAPIVIGQELPDSRENRYKPVTMENPYRTETIQKGSTRYTVDYYFVGIVKADGKVSDDELEPLIFQNDRLIGQGWGYLRERIKNE